MDSITEFGEDGDDPGLPDICGKTCAKVLHCEDNDKKISKGMSWMSVVPRAKELLDLSAQQWRDRVHLQYRWDLQGLPEKCDGCGKRFSTDHALLICMNTTSSRMSWRSSAGRPGTTVPGSRW